MACKLKYIDIYLNIFILIYLHMFSRKNILIYYQRNNKSNIFQTINSNQCHNVTIHITNMITTNSIESQNKL